MSDKRQGRSNNGRICISQYVSKNTHLWRPSFEMKSTEEKKDKELSKENVELTGGENVS